MKECIVVQCSVAVQFLPILNVAMEAILSAGTAVNGASAKHAYDILVDAQRSSAMFLVDEPKYLGANSLSTALVMNIMSKARTCDEETFGPSATIYVIDTEKDAMVMTNGSPCDLSAATHSRSWERAYQNDHTIGLWASCSEQYDHLGCFYSSDQTCQMEWMGTV